MLTCLDGGDRPRNSVGRDKLEILAYNARHPVQTYRFADVLAHTGVTRSQLIHWTDRGLIAADVANAAGTGHHRVFSFRNLVEIRVAVLLARYRMPIPSLASVMQVVRRQLGLGRRSRGVELLWIPEPRARSGQVWAGSIEEFSHELHRPFFVNHRVGLLLNVRSIVEDIETSTQDVLT
jgi:DNA-binding transcriptional MerR regulator